MVGQEINFPTTDGGCRQNTHSHDTCVQVQVIRTVPAQMFHAPREHAEQNEARPVQILDSEWFKTDHRAVLAVLSLKAKVGYSAKPGVNLRRDVDRLENWDVMAPLLLETAKAYKMMETNRKMTVTELELKSLLLQKKRDGRHFGRAELNRLCRAFWRKQRALKRQKYFDQDQGKCRCGESNQENTKQTFQLEFDCETRESRNSSHRLLPRPLLNSCGPRRHRPIRENSLDSAMKSLRMDCAGGTLI